MFVGSRFGVRGCSGRSRSLGSVFACRDGVCTFAALVGEGCLRLDAPGAVAGFKWVRTDSDVLANQVLVWAKADVDACSQHS